MPAREDPILFYRSQARCFQLYNMHSHLYFLSDIYKKHNRYLVRYHNVLRQATY